MTQTTVVSPYADYVFYKDVYFGEALQEKDFKRLELRAEEQLDWLTFHRIRNLDDKYLDAGLEMDIRKAVCAMAEATAEAEDVGFGIDSENNDGYSASYSQNMQSDQKERMRAIAAKYLGYSGLLYRGGGKWHED